MAEPTIDAPGTCHLVGCPGKGQHPPHGIGIGAGTWTDYTDPAHCLGFPTICADRTWLLVECSIGKSSGWHTRTAHLTPDVMAELVDQHKAECTNRSPR